MSGGVRFQMVFKQSQYRLVFLRAEFAGEPTGTPFQAGDCFSCLRKPNQMEL